MSEAPVAIDVERLEQSKDPRLRRFLAAAVDFFETSGLTYAAFGSCAAFAHRGRMHRLTRDLDVLLPRADFERLEAVARAAGFEAERERPHFVRLRRDIFQVHAVPEVFEQFDYRTLEPLASVHTGIDWEALERRPLRFVTGLEPLALPVPPLETVLALAFLRPINTNSFADVTALLTAPSFSGSGLAVFAARNPRIRALLVAQLERLSSLEPALAGVADRARAAIEAEGGAPACRA